MAMNCNCVEDIIRLIMNRDNISYNEARACVQDTQTELDYIVNRGGSYDEAADIIYEFLGLEPDYLPILIDG